MSRSLETFDFDKAPCTALRASVLVYVSRRRNRALHSLEFVFKLLSTTRTGRDNPGSNWVLPLHETDTGQSSNCFS